MSTLNLLPFAHFARTSKFPDFLLGISQIFHIIFRDYGIVLKLYNFKRPLVFGQITFKALYKNCAQNDAIRRLNEVLHPDAQI